MENDVQEVEEQEEDLDLNLEETPEDTDPEEEMVTVSKKKLQTLQIQRNKWKEKAQTPKTEQITQAPQEVPEDITVTVKGLAIAEKKRQFGYQNGLSPEETDAVFKIDPNPTKETLKDPFILGGLEHIRKQKRVEDATPSSSKRSQSINGKSWAEMSKEERAKNYAASVAKSAGR